MAKRRKKRVASRGSVNNIILKTLVNGDKYGYEIIKEVEEFSDGKIVLKQPSLYSSLGRFEEKGIVSSYWEDSDIGGRRHYYHLTEVGHEYYEKEVLKKRDDEDMVDDEEDENSPSEMLDNDEVTFTEASENEIPAFAEFPDTEEKVIIPDHHFYKETPMEETQDQYAEQYVLKKEPSAYHSSPVTISTSSTNVSSFFRDDTKEEKPWEDMANSTKQNNSKIIGTPLSKLRFGRQTVNEEENSAPPSCDIIEQSSIEESVTDNAIEQPVIEESTQENDMESTNAISTITEQKKTKIILDKDGIYKLRDADYDPNQASQKAKPTVIDNVIKRTNSSVIYGYSAYTEQNKKEPTPKSNIEISDEERKIKNDNFIQKFNSLSSFKKMEKKEEDLDKNYLQKLDLLKKSYEETPTQVTQAPTPTNAGPIITKSILDEEDEEEYEDEGYDTYREPQKNNLFEYEEEDAFVDLGDDEIADDDEDESDSLVDLEPEKFEVKNENRQYIEEISNYSTPKESIKINRYENKPTAILSDKTYVLINKIKFVFGIIMSLLMVGELLLTQYILKSNGLIVDGDNVLFIVGYSIVGVLALIYILPFIFSQNEHKLNNYKTKYAILFGILTFLVSIILIYCTNALMGFKLSNFEYFATKLIVPAVLVFNFVILPIIYGLLLKSKKFYG